jgi:hypothetical protein
MEKHFCTCNSTKCQKHPAIQNGGCDLCIKKNLEQGEIPACFWINVSNGVKGSTDYSVENFVKFYLDNKEQKN